MPELSKAYEPHHYEDAIYKQWEKSGLFAPEKSAPADTQEHFSVVLPPPNVTGTLHMGHAAMLAIEDVMVRFHRMKGDRTLWVPGTDHAAIATQSKVEKIIAKNLGKTKYDLGRTEFLKHVQAFAQESHDTIVNQCKKMGASLDWNREAYTLDNVRSQAVRLVFKQMYDDGLIYQGHRIVNWDPDGQTTVSDDEIVYKEEKTTFYYFQYGPFVIGTARPETKFGDKYVVVHPDDERYQGFTAGQTIHLEWINGPITATIIKDEAIDKNFGTGAMTITPWHSTIDFDIAGRHDLDKEQIINEEGKLLPIAGEFAGLDIRSARKLIVEKLRAKGLVVKEEEYVHQVATAERSGGIIEPQIKKQWFIGVNKPFKLRHSALKNFNVGDEVTLKQLLQSVVRGGEIKIIPDRFEKTYFSWIDNLRDWCISRQIWFGHQIPVYYCQGSPKSEGRNAECAKPQVSVGQSSACQYCGSPVLQDPDTLDTWFSSGLWTFSTLLDKNILDGETLEAWVARSSDIKQFHPTSVLETGYDIIFFWVARMILMTTYALGDVPFKTVYLHGLVRDEQGRKMSKSLGNIINPLDMIEKFGTDATRLSLLLGSTPGNDVKLSEEKIAGFRNFTNKLWNIARFMLLSIEKPALNAVVDTATLSDAWIVARLERVRREVTHLLETSQFSAAGERLREFTWTELADWYLEIAKIEGGKAHILNAILNTLLKLWHPFMPFVTEALWREMYGETSLLMVERWPGMLECGEIVGNKDYFDNASFKPTMAEQDFAVLQEIITVIRTARAEQRIEPVKKLRASITTSKKGINLIKNNLEVIKQLTRLEQLDTDTLGQGMSLVVGEFDIRLDTAGAVDVEKEKARLTKELVDVERFIGGLSKKLDNAEFVKNAPPAVVEGERKKLLEATEKGIRLHKELASLT